MPKFGVPFKPKLETKVTEPKPFSFAERMRVDQQKKEEKIMKLAEEKNQVIIHLFAGPSEGPILLIKRNTKNK